MRRTIIRLSSKNLSFDKNEVSPFLFRSSGMVLRVSSKYVFDYYANTAFFPAKNTILINLVRSY